MSEAAKLREMMKSKAKRLASADPHQKVDSSSWTPPEPLNADVKTGMRPVSRRAYKKGGKVMGECGPARADRKPRKSGGKAAKTDDTPMVDRYINRDLKKANEFRDGKKHIGGMKKGGKADASASNLNKMTTESYRRELEKTQSTEGGEPQASDLYDKQQLERLERGYKKGGRPKKFSGGDVLKVLSPIAMLAGLGKDDDEKKARGGRNKPSKRAKRNAGGLLNDPRTAGDAILQNSAAASGTSPDRMSFAPGMPAQGMKKFLGLKTGGKAKHPDEAMDKALIRKMVKSSARKGRAEGGTLATAPAPAGTFPANPTVTAPAPAGTFPANPIATTAVNPVLKASTGAPAAVDPRQANMARRAANQAGRAAEQAARNKERMAERSARQASRDARRNPIATTETTGTAATTDAATTGATTAADTTPKMKPSPRYGSAAMVPAKKGGRIGKFGGGALGYAKGGDVFSGSGYPGKIPGVVPGGRVARKSGGKAKGSGRTNINIVIAGKPQSDMEAPMPPMPPPAGPAAPPPMGGAPGMPPMPPAPPMGGPGPMGRKAGGRAYKSYKDMDAGAGSGLGRLEKTEIAKRTAHKAGGRAYKSYKDMDAGAGSGLGRLEKTEIASRRTGS